MKEGGAHVLSWSYEKDGGDTFEGDFDNCVWLDSVKWTPTDPIPDLGENPTAAQVEAALDGSKDGKLKDNITDGENYVKYRDWAGKVKAKGGSAVGAQAAKDAPNAWLSFALDSETLIENAPTNGTVKVEKFEPKGENGKFDFTVSVEDVEIGSEAQTENLKKIFGLEGASSLDADGFSTTNVDLTFEAPTNGMLRFTAGPKNTAAPSFFMKVKMTP